MKLFLLLFMAGCCCSMTGWAQGAENMPADPTKQAADSSGNVVIRSINVTGNKKTKTYLVLREIQFKKGDIISLAKFAKDLKQSRDLVYNTTLFTDVIITPEYITPYEVNVNVVVKEKWYIYPTPQFQLIDRNLNEWIKVYKADLDRVVYGAKFVHYNLSGRRDQLRVYLLNGYARNISVAYTAPYSNPTLTEGFGIAASFTQNRETPFKTSYNNKLVQFKDERRFVRNNFAASASYIVRKGFYRRHLFNLGYTYNAVNDSITSFYNTAYFNTAKPYKGYAEASYSFQYINTNNINYPLTGKIYGASMLKRGAGLSGGINMLMVDVSYNRFIEHKKNWYSMLQFNAKIKAPFDQPYINQRAFGFDNLYLRGLEYYVIDGVAAALARYTLKKKIISFNIPMPFKIRTVPKIPVTIFAKTYGDAGYSYNKPRFNTMLNNKMLYSGGFGIDILTLYDINLKLEYSFNQLGENGLFLHARGGF